MIGIGNRYRTDDGAGLAVAERLRETPGLDVRSCEREPVALLDDWDGAGTVLVIDAVSSGAEPGTIHRLDASSTPLPASFRGSTSTHAFGLADAIELARTLGRLPSQLTVYGIEGQTFTSGTTLTDPVAAAVGVVAAEVRQAALVRAQRRPEA